ncbi:MAG: CBS domain-containing protein [Phycisphaeraceae bacterium]|nr:CBS domain-containing protein [Phycisphaeraceae bacterium]
MGLRADILNQPISELPLRPVIKVQSGQSIRQAMQKMLEAMLGCAVVVDAQGRYIGKFTERRLMAALLQGSHTLDGPVDALMFGTQDCVLPTDHIALMIQMMESRKLRFIVVVDAEGRPVALTGQKGVMEYLAEHFPRQVKVQKIESKLHLDQREGA